MKNNIRRHKKPLTCRFRNMTEVAKLYLTRIYFKTNSLKATVDTAAKPLTVVIDTGHYQRWLEGVLSGMEEYYDK